MFPQRNYDLEGICHTYIDKDADKEKALNVCVNAKMRRPGICGAVETILIHDDIAESFVPILVNALNAQACEIRGCEKIVKYSESVNTLRFLNVSLISECNIPRVN